MKDYLIQLFQGNNVLKTLKRGDVIEWEMPPFCSGDYTAEIKEDEYGLYIDHDDNFLKGCRDFTIKIN